MAIVAKFYDPEEEGQLSIRDMFLNPTQVSATFDEGQLLKGEEEGKKLLIGVPHVITRITYQLPSVKLPRGYVTVTATLADRDTLDEACRRKWVPNYSSVSELLFTPEEEVKYNDGGTGIRRQLTAMLHNMGLINVADTIGDVSDYDASWYWESDDHQPWMGFSQSSKVNDPNGSGKIDVPDFTMDKNGRPLRVVVRHGLRVSHMDEFDTDVYYLN